MWCKKNLSILGTLLLVLPIFIKAQPSSGPAFNIVPLGVKGGLDESNLSAYMIAPAGTNTYICADAGTIGYGIEQAIRRKSFRGAPAKVLKEYIKGYLVSHAHLDHVAGLVLNSPEDTAKNIYAFPYVINTLKEKYFTWESWANFANEGEKPILNKYKYITLSEGTEISLDNTGMSMKPFVLSHSYPYESAAFLIRNKEHYLLYLGDTGADAVEHSQKMLTLWQAVAPLIRSNQLRAIFIEVSFPNDQPDKQLFGHLTPHWLMQEMDVLQNLCGAGPLKNVNIVITHIKPPVWKAKLIRTELQAANKLGLNLVFPVQGKKMFF